MSAPTKLLRSPSQAVRPSTVGRLRSLLSDHHQQRGQGNAGPSKTTTPLSPVAKPLTTLQDANPRNMPEAWFNSAFLLSKSSRPPGQQPDENKVKLGKTLRILQERLPTLLQSPLPQEVLSPSISLHLFPSTHPHLPAVSGRVAYKAALWTSPIAWNRVPVVGNVRLEILSERMVRGRLGNRHRIPAPGAPEEQLVVRWRTIGGKGKSNWGLSFLNGGGDGREGTGGGGVMEGRGGVVGTSQQPGEEKEFTGLFIFEFDSEGRILSHTIEHVDEGGNWEHGVGAKVVGLTDWLLGGMKGGREGSDTPCPAFARKER